MDGLRAAPPPGASEGVRPRLEIDRRCVSAAALSDRRRALRDRPRSARRRCGHLRPSPSRNVWPTMLASPAMPTASAAAWALVMPGPVAYARRATSAAPAQRTPASC